MKPRTLSCSQELLRGFFYNLWLPLHWGGAVGWTNMASVLGSPDAHHQGKNKLSKATHTQTRQMALQKCIPPTRWTRFKIKWTLHRGQPVPIWTHWIDCVRYLTRCQFYVHSFYQRWSLETCSSMFHNRSSAYSSTVVTVAASTCQSLRVSRYQQRHEECLHLKVNRCIHQQYHTECYHLKNVSIWRPPMYSLPVALTV